MVLPAGTEQEPAVLPFEAETERAERRQADDPLEEFSRRHALGHAAVESSGKELAAESHAPRLRQAPAG